MLKNIESRNPYLVNNTFRKYLYPILISSVTLSLGAFSDAIVVGNLLGHKGLSAINLAIPILQLANSFITLIFVGGSIVVSRAIGANDLSEVRSWFSTTLFAAGIFSLIVIVIGNVFLDHIVRIICSAEELRSFVKDYVGILLCWGIPIFTFSIGLCGYARVDSSPKLVTIAMIAANLINLVLDIVFIRYFQMGIKGAAIASCVGFTAGILIPLIHFTSKRNHLFLGKIKPIKEWKVMLYYGGATALSSLLISVKIFSINAIVSSALGVFGLSIIAVCISTLSLIGLFIGGFSQTMQIVCSAMIGSQDQYGYRETLYTTMKNMTICLLVPSLFIMFFPGIYGDLFGISTVENHTQLVTGLRLFVLSIPLIGVNCLVMMVYQLANRPVMAFVIAFTQSLLVIPFMYLLQNWGEIPLWMSFVISEVVVTLIIVACRVPLFPKWKGRILFQTSQRVYDKENIRLEVADLPLSCRLQEKLYCDIDHIVASSGKWSHLDIIVGEENDKIVLLVRDNAPFNPERTLVLGLNQISKSYDLRVDHTAI